MISRVHEVQIKDWETLWYWILMKNWFLVCAIVICYLHVIVEFWFLVFLRINACLIEKKMLEKLIILVKFNDKISITLIILIISCRKFEDIFDVDHFIEYLKDDVRIVRDIPEWFVDKAELFTSIRFYAVFLNLIPCFMQNLFDFPLSLSQICIPQTHQKRRYMSKSSIYLVCNS